eukprot:c18336_g1_i2 orf=171-410(+)
MHFLGTSFIQASSVLPFTFEAGEEMFGIRWEPDDSVWYEIFSFSRPAHILSKVAYPYVRWRQKLFIDRSMKAMLKGIHE